MRMSFKKLVLLFSILFSSMILKAQEGGINLTNKKTNKTLFLKERKRILIRTDNNKSYKGRFKIVDGNSIAIGKDTIAMTSVVKIKRRPIGLAIASGVLVSGIGSPIIIACAVQGGIAVLIVPVGVAIDGVGLVIPTLSKGYKTEDWSYTIAK